MFGHRNGFAVRLQVVQFPTGCHLATNDRDLQPDVRSQCVGGTCRTRSGYHIRPRVAQDWRSCRGNRQPDVQGLRYPDLHRVHFRRVLPIRCRTDGPLCEPSLPGPGSGSRCRAIGQSETPKTDNRPVDRWTHPSWLWFQTSVRPNDPELQLPMLDTDSSSQCFRSDNQACN